MCSYVFLLCNISVILLLECIETTSQSLSEGVMVILSFLDKPLNAATYLLGKVYIYIYIYSL